MDQRSDARASGLSSASVVAIAAMFVALIALVFSMAGRAGAGLPKESKGEVELLTTATGTVTTAAESVPVPFVLSDDSFTWGAEDHLLVVMHTTASGGAGEGECPVRVVVEGLSAGAFFIQFGGFSLEGEPGISVPTKNTTGFLPPGTDKTITLVAQAWDECPDEPDTGANLTFDLSIAVLALR